MSTQANSMNAPDAYARMAGTEKVQFKIGGMACSFCVASITKALGRMEGVRDVSVNLAHEETLIEYEPRASGQPRGKEYILRGRNTVSEPREIGRFAYNAEGRLVSKSSGEPLESHHMLVGQFQRGLVIMAALVATDGSAESFASATPFPIEGRDGPCRLWLEVLSPDGMAFSAHGEGFAPGELVRMTSHSDGEQMSLPLNALADGSLPVQLMFPATVGKGYRASLQARSSNCSPGVEYEWGPPAVKAR